MVKIFGVAKSAFLSNFTFIRDLWWVIQRLTMSSIASNQSLQQEILWSICDRKELALTFLGWNFIRGSEGILFNSIYTQFLAIRGFSLPCTRVTRIEALYSHSFIIGAILLLFTLACLFVCVNFVPRWQYYIQTWPEYITIQRSLFQFFYWNLWEKNKSFSQ